MKLSETIEWWTGQKAETLTVAGLINALSQYDGNLPVIATWEGVSCPVQKDSISIGAVSSKGAKITALILDVDAQF